MAVTFDGSVFNENDPLISGIDMHTDALVPPHSHCGDKATAIHPGDIMEIFIWELRILIRTQGRVPTPPGTPATHPPTHRPTVGTVGIAGFPSQIFVIFFCFFCVRVTSPAKRFGCCPCRQSSRLALKKSQVIRSSEVRGSARRSGGVGRGASEPKSPVFWRAINYSEEDRCKFVYAHQRKEFPKIHHSCKP